MSGFDDVVRAAALGARNRPLTEASLSAPVAAVLSGAVVLWSLWVPRDGGE